MTRHTFRWGDPRLIGVVFLLPRILKPHLTADVIVVLLFFSELEDLRGFFSKSPNLVLRFFK